MKLKKWFALTLITILALSLASCGGTGASAPAVSTATPQGVAPAPPPQSGGSVASSDAQEDITPPSLGFPVEPPVSQIEYFDTLVCYTDTGFDSIAIVLTEAWGDDTELGNFDIEDLTVYVDGEAHPVTDFRVVPWDGFDGGVAAYHILFDEEFKDYPAQFTVSATIKGVELTRFDFPLLIADENGDFTVRRNAH